jgi:DNA-binding beta-propeller fold protein YncE
MDETSLHELFERVIEPEPPIGTVAQKGIRAGIRLRRRRRAQQAVAGAAAVAVACTAVVAAASLAGHGGSAASAGTRTVYVLSSTASSTSPAQYVTPISAATDAPGTPIAVTANASGTRLPLVPDLLDTMTATPDGKMIYVVDPNSAVTPVFTATGTAGKPIPFPQPPGNPLEVVAAPDGKTVYVLAPDGEVTPISTATNTPGTPIWVNPPGTTAAQTLAMSIAITPDGRTLYVGVDALSATVSGNADYVIPVDTATDRPGKSIRLPGGADAIVVTPDGRTAYVIGGATPDFTYSFKIAVTPIATATNTAGPAVIAGRGVGGGPPVMTPDGRHIYIPTSSPTTPTTFSLIPFSTAADSGGKPISFGDQEILALAAAPDGQTVYAASEKLVNDGMQCPEAAGVVTPVATATNLPGKPVQVACTPNALAVTQDSKTVYVASYNSSQGSHSGLANYSGHGTVTPIAAATGLAGTPIEVTGDPRTMLITP